MRNILSKPFYLYDSYLSRNWIDYSKLIIKSDNYNWVFDNIRKELKNVFDNLQVDVINDRFFYNTNKQCVLFLSKYDVLKYIDNSDHKISFSYFHGNPKINKKNNDLFQNFLKKINKIEKIHVSNTIMENILLDNNIPKSKIHKIPISIKIEDFKFLQKEQKMLLRKQLKLPLDKKIIGSFQKDGIGWRKGSLPKLEKGPDILIKALIEIKKEYKDIHVLLTGPSRGYVINELIRHNIDYTYSKFINFNKINSYYNVLDLYLVTSREEGGPRAILESMATGTPIISTKVGQAIDIINNANNGFLVDINDYNQICKTALDIFENKYDLENILKNARTTAKDNSYNSQLKLWNKFLNNYITK